MKQKLVYIFRNRSSNSTIILLFRLPRKQLFLLFNTTVNFMDCKGKSKSIECTYDLPTKHIKRNINLVQTRKAKSDDGWSISLFSRRNIGQCWRFMYDMGMCFLGIRSYKWMIELLTHLVFLLFLLLQSLVCGILWIFICAYVCPMKCRRHLQNFFIE